MRIMVAWVGMGRHSMLKIMYANLRNVLKQIYVRLQQNTWPKETSNLSRVYMDYTHVNGVGLFFLIDYFFWLTRSRSRSRYKKWYNNASITDLCYSLRKIVSITISTAIKQNCSKNGTGYENRIESIFFSRKYN